MIRALIKSGYDRTIGTLSGVFWDIFGSTLRRGNVLSVLYVLIVVGLMGGFINAIVFPVPNQGIVVYPGAGAQTIPEAMLDSFVILLGGAGIYLTYVSGRQTTRVRTVNLYLGIAFILIAVSLLAGIQLASLK